MDAAEHVLCVNMDIRKHGQHINASLVNLPTGDDYFVLKKQAADDNFFGQLLCIKKSSNPKLSDEYPGKIVNQ
eukprot:1160714-Pelagomonas_calceolata.AAC.14